MAFNEPFKEEFNEGFNDDLARQIADDMLKLYGEQKWRKYLVSNS